MRDADLTTLGEQAYRTMRSMIVRGELSAGQWLRKRSLATQLQMSATPVVEALRKLEHEGLVSTEPQWGTRVRAFTVNEIEELAGMRVMLESFVARKAAERLKPAQIASLKDLAIRVDEIDTESGDPGKSANFINRPDAFALDHEFHLRLAVEAQLPLVYRELERLQVLKATCRRYLSPTPPTSVPHVDLVEAIASGDAGFAEHLMRQHIQRAVDVFLPVLRARFGDDPVLPDRAPRIMQNRS